jgi:hypothetical protein
MNNTLYQALVYAYILGMILLADIFTITAFWKVLAALGKGKKLGPNLSSWWDCRRLTGET